MLVHWPANRHNCRPAGWTALAIAVVASCLASGCVQRRLTIRSNPPGALVYVDNEEIGITPVATDFIYYGTRQIRLVKDGFETVTVLQPIPAPWYQYFPIDFFAENVVPGEIRDERVLDFTLVPQVIVHGDELLQRAEDLRRSTQSQIIPPSMLPPVPGVMPIAPQPQFVPQPQVVPQQPLPLPAHGAQPPVLIEPLPPVGAPPLQTSPSRGVLNEAF